MKTTGNFWFPLQGQTQWPDDAQISPSEKKEPAPHAADVFDQVFGSSTSVEVRESVTVSDMVFTPDEIRGLLYFVKAKAQAPK